MYPSAAAMTAPPATNFAFRVMGAGSARRAAVGGWRAAAPCGRGAASRRGAPPRRGRRRRGRSPSCPASGRRLRLEPEHAHTPGEEVEVEERERREVHEERGDDRPRHAAPAGLHQRRRLVQRAPPVDREVDERDVERRDDAEDGGRARGALGLLERAAEQEIADVHHEQDRHAREARVPRPPGAPRRLAPDRARRDREAREEDAELGRGVRDAVGGGRAPGQVYDRGREHDGERDVGDPDARHVQVHDALHVALRRLARRDGEAHHEAREESRRREPPERRGHDSSRKSNVSSPATTYTTSAAARSLSQWATADRGSPRRMASVALTEPSRTGTWTGSSSTGKSSSRARTCAVIAAKSVPTAASPSVPSATTTDSAGSAAVRSTLKKTVKRPSSIASTANIRSTLPASFPA